MTRFTLFRGSLLAALLAGACGGPTPATTRAERLPFDLDATRRLIAQQNERFTHAHVTGDIATIDSMFAPDAKSFPPGAGVTEFREETTDFYGNAEYVVDAGTYVVTYGPAHVTERGKYLNVWTPVNGSWKIKANMWNTDAPAPTPT